MNKKTNIYSDQSSSSRIDKIKKEVLNSMKIKENVVTKQNNDRNPEIDALSRVRGGGYVVPQKITQKNVSDS